MAFSDKRQLIAVADPAAMANAAAERLVARIEVNPGRAAICLAGGPRALVHRRRTLCPGD
jgi:6-phosphogluconolactonase